jgi:hypothetical protein
VSDDFKIGFNDGLMDGASSDPASGATSGPNRKARYASSPSYKSGYDRGWHEATVPYGVKGVGSAGMGGMPRQWWSALPRATAADFGMVSGHYQKYPHPWA